MQTFINHLFAWDQLQDSPSLGRIRDLLASIPDGPLLESLAQRRSIHRGCNTYPVRVLWGCLLLSILLRHLNMEACLEELRRNAPLRLLIDIQREEDVPNGWNLTPASLAVLGQESFQSELTNIFDVMVAQLGESVPDLGRPQGDATRRLWRDAASQTKHVGSRRLPRDCPELPEDNKRSTKTMRARSPKWSNGSATSSICSWMSSTR